MKIPDPAVAQTEKFDSYYGGSSWRRYTDSSSFKMALILTLFMGVSAAVLGYFINQFNTGTLIDRAEIAINADYASFNDWQEMGPELSIPEVIDKVKKTRQRSLNSYQGLYSYQDAEGQYIYSSLIAADVEMAPFHGDMQLLYVEAKDVNFILDFEGVHRFAARTFMQEDGSKLLVARDIEQPLQERTRMQQLGLLTVVLMLVVIVGSFYFSTYVVGLINSIGETAKEIMETGDFSRRIEFHKGGDDLSNLATVLNDLFEKAESLMLSVRQVSDNIAHDLRTPLTRLRNRLDQLDDHIKTQNDGASEEITEALIREADHILGTFGALLRIARIETGSREKEFEMVDMVPLLEDILELYQPLAEEKGVELVSTIEPSVIWGDPDMLFQVFANLMDNAVKFTPEAGRIELLCRRKYDHICISLTDSGVGISDDEKLKVFDRFYRAEQSRRTSGNGLGLSLVQAVMKLHKADISIEDNNPGSRFLIKLRLYQRGLRKA